jgi:hypothetical protein
VREIYQYHHIRSLGMVYDMDNDLFDTLHVKKILLLVLQQTYIDQLNSLYHTITFSSTI